MRKETDYFYKYWTQNIGANCNVGIFNNIWKQRKKEVGLSRKSATIVNWLIWWFLKKLKEKYGYH